MSSSQTTDDDLIRRAVEGDRNALTQLIYPNLNSALLAWLHRQIQSGLRGRLTADDILQEAYIKAFRYIGTLRQVDPYSFRGWMFAILQNQFRDALRGLPKEVQAQATHSSVADLVDVLPADGKSPSSAVAGLENVHALREAVARLPHGYREPVELYYLEGLSVAEVAERLNVRKATLYMRFHRGKEMLREIMGTSSRFFSN